MKLEVAKEHNDQQVLFENFKQEYKQVQKGIDDVHRRLDEVAGVYGKSKDEIKSVIEQRFQE